MFLTEFVANHGTDSRALIIIAMPHTLSPYQGLLRNLIAMVAMLHTLIPVKVLDDA